MNIFVIHSHRIIDDRQGDTIRKLLRQLMEIVFDILQSVFKRLRIVDFMLIIFFKYFNNIKRFVKEIQAIQKKAEQNKQSCQCKAGLLHGQITIFEAELVNGDRFQRSALHSAEMHQVIIITCWTGLVGWPIQDIVQGRFLQTGEISAIIDLRLCGCGCQEAPEKPMFYTHKVIRDSEEVETISFRSKNAV